MINRIAAIALVSIALIVGSCKDDTTTPPTGSNFDVTIHVSDQTGNPVPGLRVSVWNKLVGTPYNWFPKAAAPTQPTSTAVIHFDVSRASLVTIDVHDMANRLVKLLLGPQELPAGSYSLQFSIDTLLPTAVFKCRMVALDSSAHMLFADSIYSVLWQPDASIAILGWTSSAGTVTTGDSLLFPNTLTLPDLKYTSADGPDSLSTFTITDSVRIVLTDTAHSVSQRFGAMVRKGAKNNISLTWTGTTASEMPPGSPVLGVKLTAVDSVVNPNPTIPTRFKLYQNFPNPFN